MRIGCWAPVYGNWIASAHASEFDAGFDHTRRTVLAAEAAGFDTVLLAEHFSNPQGADLDQLDAWTSCAALAVLTSRIEIIAAVKPGLRAPGVIAKMGASIDALSHGRFAINLIAAWWLREFEMMGAPVLGHDDRYARMAEFTDIVLGLWRGPGFSHAGSHFTITDATISPRPVRRPPVYVGGDSPAGRAFAARYADVFLMNGRPVDEARATVAAIDALAQGLGRPAPRYGMAGFVVCRPTRAEAEAEVERLVALRTIGKVVGDSTASRQTAALTDEAARRKLGTNNGSDMGLVGTPADIAARLRAYEAAGVETFLLQFHPMVPELERFGRDVMPLLR